MASDPVVSNALVLEVLNRNNYKHWRSRMKTYLLSEDLWDIVDVIKELPAAKFEDEYKAWTQKNAKALYAIQNSCGSEMFSFISEIEIAKSAWKTLEQECKIVQGYDENNVDHLERYVSFTESVSSGNWDKAKECLGKVELHSVVRAINPRDNFGDIALHVAARKGHVHIVKELVQLMKQEYLKTKNAYGFTALHIAVKERHAHIVKELGPLMGEVKDGEGDTALHIAIKENQLDIVKDLVLLMSREDLKIKNDDGYTALHLEVNKGNMPIVKEFVKKEGENHIVEDTALHVAATQGNAHIVKQLLSLLKVRQEDLELKTTSDFIAFGSGVNLEVSEEVVMERAKYTVEQHEKMLSSVLDVQNAKGFTALHLAVLKGHVDIVKELVLLMRPEGLEIKNVDGDSPLHLAVGNENVDIVKELVPLMRKEGLEIKNVDGDIVLNKAVLRGHVDIVKELVRWMRVEDLEVKNYKGSNALHLAAMKGHMNMVKELVRWMRVEGLEAKK